MLSGERRVVMARAFGTRDGRPLWRRASFWLAAFGLAVLLLFFALWLTEGDEPPPYVYPLF